MRHQRDEFAAGRQMAEVGDLDALGADLAGQRFDLLMRQFQELVDQTQFVHQLERRRMNRVTAEIAEEVRMLLQHHDTDSGAGQQNPSIIPAGPPPAIQHCVAMLESAIPVSLDGRYRFGRTVVLVRAACNGQSRTRLRQARARPGRGLVRPVVSIDRGAGACTETNCPVWAQRERRTLSPTDAAGSVRRGKTFCRILRKRVEQTQVAQRGDHGVHREPGLKNSEDPPQDLKAHHANTRDDLPRQEHANQIEQHDEKQ